MKITLECQNRPKHRTVVTTPEAAERLHGTACDTCFKPMFVTKIEGRPGEKASKQ